MLGQIGGASELNITQSRTYDSSSTLGHSDGLEAALKSLFGEEFPSDPGNFILKEKLDDRESYLMDGENIHTCPPLPALFAHEALSA